MGQCSCRVSGYFGGDRGGFGGGCGGHAGEIKDTRMVTVTGESLVNIRVCQKSHNGYMKNGIYLTHS